MSKTKSQKDSILQYPLSVLVGKPFLHRWIKSPDERSGVIHQYLTYVCVICPQTSSITTVRTPHETVGICFYELLPGRKVFLNQGLIIKGS